MTASSTRSPKTAPWGSHKFVEPRTYAPKFHQPLRLRHIDQNSTLDLGWENVKPREKPKTVVEEMKETLDKINGLLEDLGSRAKSSTHIARTRDVEQETKTDRPMRDSTINSCLESLCDDISAVTDQLKQLSPKPNHRQQRPSEAKTIRAMDTGNTLTTDHRPPSRKSSISTLNSQISSIDTSVEDQTRENHIIQTERPENTRTLATPTTSTRKRSRSCSDAGSQTQSMTYHRGSEISQEVSMHRSNFSSIADLCGYGDSVPIALSRERIAAARQLSKSNSSFYLLPKPTQPQSRGVHFTEYPPQRGSGKFDGIFHDDITALLDDTARGLLVL